MTSQNWLTKAQVNRTEWWHYVVVMIPNKVKYTTGFVWLAPDAGDNDEKDIPSAKSVSVYIAGLIATSTNCVVTAVFQLPNQPLVFADDPSHKNRS
jgi:PhoPQ-activated pathogenicity-related protein